MNSSRNAATASAKSRGAGNARRPHRMVERGEQQADHGGIDAAQRRLRRRPSPQLFPERQRADRPAGTTAGTSATRQMRGAEPAVRLRPHDGAEIGGEGEQRARHGLRGAVAGEERVVGHPAGRHDRRLQQRQHDVAAAEHQRAGAVEGVEQLERLRLESPRPATAGRSAARRTITSSDARRRAARRSAARRRDRSACVAAQQQRRRRGRRARSRRPGPRRRATRATTTAATTAMRGALAVGRQRAHHAEHRLRDHRHRGDLEAVQPAGARQRRRARSTP